MADEAGAYCVMVVAAEASSDALGAELIQALKRRLGPGRVRFVGVGGERMAAEGIESPFDISDISIVGLVEAVRAYPRVVRRADETRDLALRERPDVAVLIDSWGFTLRVAQRLKRVLPELTVIKYVGPQVWASRPGRAWTLARTVDHLLAIHSFDPPYFEAAGLRTTFVGNPILSRTMTGGDRDGFRARAGAREDDPVLLVAPGSRRAEIRNVEPAFRAGVTELLRRIPDLRVIGLVAPTVSAEARAAFAAWPTPVTLAQTDQDKLDAIAAADVALACSGTVTTEIALGQRPVVVGYRMDAITYTLIRPLIRTPYATLINVAAGAEVAPELIQSRCAKGRIADALAGLLSDPDARARQVGRQNEALAVMGLGGPDPSERAADVVMECLGRRPVIGAPG